LQTAEHLSAQADVEILTTCAVDYQTWHNVYPPGIARVRGVDVRRFHVDQPRTLGFDGLSRALRSRLRSASADSQIAWMRAQGPLSRSLMDFLATSAERYDAILFFSYLYATTFFNLPLVAERAILVPLAHDEWMLRLSLWDDIFAAPRAIVYLTPEERELVRGRFARLPAREHIGGLGIDPPADRDGGRFRDRFDLHGPFVLYLGRIEPAKGCDVLLDGYRRYRKRRPGAPKFVLAGPQHMPIPRGSGALFAGRLDERAKWDALEACELLIMPSPFESLSIALLEAWSVGRPALVNAVSAALAGQARRSQGAICYKNYAEFAAALDMLDEPMRRSLGARAQTYVAQNYRWDRVVTGYAMLVEEVAR
jgi:glycosyltransferase involved in cell wall biosynthesis